MLNRAAALKHVSITSAAMIYVAFAFCSVGLAGWIFDIVSFTSIGPGWPRMSVPTILCFFLCGAMILQGAFTRYDNRIAEAARLIAIAVVLLIGGYAIATQFVAGGADDGYVFGPHLGRVAPATALNFLLLGVALAMPGGNLAGHVYAGLVAFALAITALALVGYAYDVEALYKVLPFSAMALPTAVSFALLLIAALLARPDAGWTAAIVSKESGGIAARSLLPAAIILPVLPWGVAGAAHRRRELETPFAFAVLAGGLVA